MRPNFNLEWIDDFIYFLVHVYVSHPLLVTACVLIAAAVVVHFASVKSVDEKYK